MSNDTKTQLVKIESPNTGALQPQSLGELERMAGMVARSGLYGIRSPEEAFVVMHTGHELGLGMSQALRGIHIMNVNGGKKPSLSAQLMHGICLQSPQCEYFSIVETTNETCTAKTKRVGQDEEVLTFTIQDARRAGLTGNNWSKYPRAMLKARATAELARQAYPDLMFGLYTPDELEAVEAVQVNPPRQDTQGSRRRDPTPTVDAQFEEESEAALEEAALEEDRGPTDHSTDPAWKAVNKAFHAVSNGEHQDRFREACKAFWGVESFKHASPVKVGKVAQKLQRLEAKEGDELTKYMLKIIEKYGPPLEEEDVPDVGGLRRSISALARHSSLTEAARGKVTAITQAIESVEELAMMRAAVSNASTEQGDEGELDERTDVLLWLIERHQDLLTDELEAPPALEEDAPPATDEHIFAITPGADLELKPFEEITYHEALAIVNDAGLLKGSKLFKREHIRELYEKYRDAELEEE